MSSGCWATAVADESSFDILAALPGLDNSSLIAAAKTAQYPSFSPAGVEKTSGGSTESALDRPSYDSDQELEAIRGSVRSLRAQRVAVEQLKKKARQEEGTADLLRRKLGNAEREVQELRAQGGRDVVRRLMDEVSELRARLKATSAAFQTREKSLAELREAVVELEQDRRAGQEKFRAQSRKLEDQDREAREQQLAIRSLEAACARCEERAAMAERRAEEKSADSGVELASLASRLREANAALEASKGTMEAAVAKHVRLLDSARKDKESLLFKKGQAQERMKELSSLAQRQRLNLAEAEHRAKELEREASEAKKEARLAQEQVREMRATLAAADETKKEEQLVSARNMDLVARRAQGLKLELVEARAEAAEKSRQLARHRNEMSAFGDDVKKLREVAAQQGEMHKAVQDRDETIGDLRQRLEQEKREREQWGRARKQLLLEFCEEENKLRWTLQTGQGQRLRQPDEHAPLAASDPTPAREQTCNPHSPRHGSANVNSDNALSRGASHVAREERRGAGSGDDVPRKSPRGVDLDRFGASGRRSRRSSDGTASVESFGVQGRTKGGGRGKRQEGRTRQMV
eukprot:jgi/Undpi1/6141/HiC_scaffold_20.g08626.m1